MVAKGHKDSHRYTYSGGVKAQEVEKWGRNKAAERYGEPRSPNMKPPDQSEPQRLGDSNNLRGPDWQDDHRQDWIVGANEDGRPPNFDKGKR